jgi:hypothetical protein
LSLVDCGSETMKESDKNDNVLEKQKNKIKELEAYFSNHGNDQISCSTEHLKMLAETGYLPKELWDYHCQSMQEGYERGEAFRKFKEENPHLSPEETMKQLFPERQLSQEETIKFYENTTKSGEFLKFLYENKELLKPDAIDEIPNKFFKSLETGEFGIARLVADPLNRVPQMLKNSTAPELIQEDIYLIKWEHAPNNGNKIRLEYRFRAPNQDEANKQAQAFIQRLTGKQKKVFEACWAMANKRMRRTYTCDLTEIMEIAYPARKNNSSFSVKERVEFYQDLLDLSQTQFIVSKKQNKRSKKQKNESFLLPFITIHKFTESESNKESERYPNQISLSVLHNPLYEDEKMYNVGAGIKYSTLELHVDDIQLAEWIQIRKSQQLEEKFIKMDRDFAIRLAGLEATNQKHTGMANKRLIDKFNRIKEKGIILVSPKRITDPIKLKIR